MSFVPAGTDLAVKLLSNLHRWMVKISSSGARQQVLKNVQMRTIVKSALLSTML
jgi:hypothetical protein